MDLLAGANQTIPTGRFSEAVSKADQLKFIMTTEAKYSMQRAILATLLLGLRGR